MPISIPFNKPFLCGKETLYIKDAVESGKISGNGKYTKLCHDFFKTKFAFPQVLLTSSCTDALEMAALLADLGPGDEVIVPSFTFVSTANSCVLRGARVRFADSLADNPNIDPQEIERLITPRTKAIMIVHYAGVSCDMEAITALARKHGLFLIEDAAHAVDSYYRGRPLGSFGDVAAFSFHETKNVIAGEGGLLVVNNQKLWSRAEILWEKGTNRAAFSRGEVHKYNWLDVGSSFLPSEIVAAFLYAQLENLEVIQKRRVELWWNYHRAFETLHNSGRVAMPVLPPYATVNGHLFYLVCDSPEERDELLDFLKAQGILAVFHYLPLHKSPFYASRYEAEFLPNAERFSTTLLRLPLFFDLTDAEQRHVIESVCSFYRIRGAARDNTGISTER